ncbi:trypsin-4-like [Centropristis striata]|uniref:trypsin-4-like n=1 Tax=Centropristis striata TaxID=184440 RepID=UPI0027E1ED66|nr:trypsin-4-like [Centropristis striata]
MAGMTCLLLLLWAGVTVSTVVDLQKRIIGGKDCDRGYHVKLHRADPDSICGGSLISNQWILTAGHCWTDGGTWKVYLGGNEVQISESKKYTVDTKDHDIILLKLSATTTTPHVNLPGPDNCKNTPEKVEVAGYGSTATDSGNKRRSGPEHRSPTLRCGEMKTLVDCEKVKRELLHEDLHTAQRAEFEYWLCGQSDDVDISPGDSGGGVVHGGIIYGVITASGSPKYALHQPAAFMDVCVYKRWIQETINGP